jgi:pSer/pThr/pTyr-binding forkhead associated (FHA) protein
MAILALMVDDVVVQRFAISNAEITIGRLSDNDIQIDDAAVSGRHARVIAQPSPYMQSQTEYFIEDLQSTNGTYINDARVERQQLSGDDELRIAWNRFKFIDEEQPNFERTAMILQPDAEPV